MPATIILKSPSGVDDHFARLSNAQFARPFDISTWTTLRVGIRWVITSDATLSSGLTSCLVGLCSGTTNLPGDATCQHAIGLGTAGVAWSASSTTFYATTTSSFISKIGTTVTTGLGGSSFTDMGAGRSDTGAQRAAWFVDFTKGSPNWTAKAFYRNDTTITLDMSQQTFLDLMAIDTPSLTGYIASSSFSFAVDEATNGTLNSVFFWWSRAVPYAEISDIAIARFA